MSDFKYNVWMKLYLSSICCRMVFHIWKYIVHICKIHMSQPGHITQKLPSISLFKLSHAIYPDYYLSYLQARSTNFMKERQNFLALVKCVLSNTVFMSHVYIMKNVISFMCSYKNLILLEMLTFGECSLIKIIFNNYWTSVEIHHI